ncbi:hypothetical protein BFJ69_g8267 [Fusarium oxysporum]|uniref:Uncharacterized protein n=1 Tax=Fusarium oxysporum TaxID=5507 RepID=A0A420N322_FUSOX|nr:hypothetical protein BFJ69_g8267 [Fusarium oxysporum]
MPLRDLDSEAKNIEKLFLLGLSQPAQERDGLKELEANSKESAKTGDLQALQTLTNPHLQPPDIKILHNIDFIQNELSLASKEISDYYQFNEDLGRWKTLSAQNQPDPFGLFEEVVGAAFALKTFPRAAPLYVPGNEGLPPRVANMHPFNPNVFAQLQSVAFDFFLQASSGKSSMPCLCRYLD